jgi:hypothetical protein
MGWHPANLVLRFVLELAALAAAGYWGSTHGSGGWRWAWAIGLPLVMAAVWGTFRVNGDPKEAPVAVPGIVRLALELAFFGGAVTLLAAAGQSRPAVIFGAVIAAHYAISYDRIAWLLQQK